MNATKSNIKKLTINDRRSLEKYPETFMEFSYLDFYTEDKSVNLSVKEGKRKESVNSFKWLDN